MAVEADDIDMCRLLVEGGTDPHLRNSKGLSAFQLATERGVTRVVEYLEQAAVPASPAHPRARVRREDPRREECAENVKFGTVCCCGRSIDRSQRAL
eukprot:3939407-Rhodomonas_salina.1